MRPDPKPPVKAKTKRKPIKRTPLKGVAKKAIGKKVVKKRKKKEKIGTWKKKVWKVFSEFIRLRDSDSHGFSKCISCDEVRFWRQMHCGHFISRRHQATWLNEFNNSCQCPKCNLYESGNQYAYCVGITKKFGEGICDTLLAESRKEKQYTIDEYKDLYVHYSREVEKMKEEKGL